MPDLQYAASQDETMTNLRDHVMSTRCEFPCSHDLSVSDIVQDSDLKNYKANTVSGPDFTKSVGPSADFIQMPVAFNYR